MRANTLSLLSSLRGAISARRERAIRGELPLLRREANKRHPPKLRAAEPTRLEVVRELLARAKRAELSRRERQALDIFLIAFVTMSRVGEVAELEAEDVAADGSLVSLRPKTAAATWLKLAKGVSDRAGLRAAERLRRYRREAIGCRRKYLFTEKRGRPPSTASVTERLKRVTRKLGLAARITAHSARKGAAVEALLAGVPIPVIQALGGWRSADTLQAYVGEAVRRTIPLLEILGKRGGEKGRRRDKEGKFGRAQ